MFYEYVADPHLPLWKRILAVILSLPRADHDNKPQNMAYHNLCTTLAPLPPRNKRSTWPQSEVYYQISYPESRYSRNDD